MGIQEKLTDWAEKVVKKYDSVAEKENCTYYTQSNLNKISDDNQVKVLILGINPGSTGGEYEEITPDGWMAAIKKCTSRLDLKNLRAVGLSSQVGTYLVDFKDVISWNDPEGKEELD